jgi:hypothetical protein
VQQKVEPDALPAEAAAEPRKLTPAAQRARAEADQRRQSETKPNLPKELAGRDGPEPTRYGDWEVKGIASDF